MKRPFDQFTGALTPTFLPKAERDHLAVQRRHQVVAEERNRRSSGLLKQGRERLRDSERKARDQLARQDKSAEREREKELDAIKEHYVGSKKPKKTIISKPSDKFRHSFEWENTDDTSRDTNSLYQNPHEAQLLFGRGFLAGIDRQQQKKSATFDRHWSDKKVNEMTERDWRIFKEDFNISYKGSKIPKPMRNWAESELCRDLLKAVERAGYKKPSPIQMAAIPLGLQQRDVIGVSETGSGKTAAFVLPMLNYIARLPPMSEENEAEGPYAVVLAPTRELAQQIEDETVKFARYLGIKVVSIVGGKLNKEVQGFKISHGCEVMIATPGRLMDCLKSRYCVLNQCNYVVLDEADRMVDLGFEGQVVEVLEAMPTSNMKPENEDEELDEKRIYRTTYMFSATMPNAVERIARKYLRNPVVVNVGMGMATEVITQNVMMLKESEKMFRLRRLLNELGDKTGIVFVNTRKSADVVFKSLDKNGFRVTSLHGGKSQDQREISLEGFRTKRYNVLVATDVAGRGIDIPDVAHVINHDMPNKIETYTHRIGRTGRAGKSGVATTFLTLSDSEVFYDLKQMLIQSNSRVPLELARHEASKFKPGSIPDRPPRRNDTVFAH